MLITDVRLFRRQWKVDICFRTSCVSSSRGTFEGLRRSDRRTTSLKATVIPPPVRGWRMFMASPSIIMPGVRLVLGGRKELGIDFSAPLSSAASNDGRTDFGRLGRTVLRR